VSAANPGGDGNSLKLSAENNGTGGVDGGATSRWVGGMVSTRDNGRYFPRFGRYEIRARLHHGQGVWPAFWLRHRDGSAVCEVDIMEYFHAQVPGHVVGVLHRTNGSAVFQSNVNPSPRHAFFEAPVAEGDQGWHTFAVEITPNPSDPADVDFAWEVDGTVFETHTDTDAGFWRDLYDDDAFDITLQGAQIGGAFAGHPNDELGYSRDNDDCLISGSPGSCATTFSGQQIRRSELADVSAGGSAATVLAMEIDYVRVWKYVGS
jgi:beta-glucanase (GH16 family)